MAIRDEVVELLSQIPLEPGEKPPSGLTSYQIEALERKLGVRVPESLRSWLALCNGGSFGPGGVFGVHSDVPFLDIETRMNRKAHWRANGWIPIAGDGNGNFYLAVSQDSDSCIGAVVFSASDHGFDATYLVASDVWHFFYFLFQREIGIHNGWPFEQSSVVARDPQILECHLAPFPWSLQ